MSLETDCHITSEGYVNLWLGLVSEVVRLSLQSEAVGLSLKREKELLIEIVCLCVFCMFEMCVVVRVCGWGQQCVKYRWNVCALLWHLFLSGLLNPITKRCEIDSSS